MADRFSQNISEQVEQLLRKFQSETLENNFFVESAGEGGVGITSADILEMLAGNSSIMDSFEREIEQRFERLGRRILSQWLENTDKQLKNSLLEVAKMAVTLFADKKLADANAVQLQRAVEGGDFFGGVEGLVARSVDSVLSSALQKTKTSVSETARSSQEVQRFRESRGQQQAQLSEEIAKGKRYQ